MAISSPYSPHTDGPRPVWWRREWVRHGALAGLLALSGVVILALVRQQTGTEGFLVGLGLAVVPVPWLTAAFRWLDRVRPGPWRNLLFAFAWGACAAALIAIVANSFATHWIATATADPSGADTLGATVIAPVVEESAKAAAVLLVFVFRRRDFSGPVGGAAIAGVTATGFAFTENILYLGNAFGTDQSIGTSGIVSVTAATFFVRGVMSPFAHPLFTVFTGIGFGLAALPRRKRRPVLRVLLPLGGLLLAMSMHALWNGSAAFGQFGFLVVYGGFMAPAFGLLAWLLIRARQRELRVAREELPVYVYAGWLAPAEPFALGSLRARRLARDHARRFLGGRPAARAVVHYETTATELALLRQRARAGRVGPDFATRERELLTTLWQTRAASRPALEYAAHVTAPPPSPVTYWQRYGHPAPPYAGYNPYRT
ncbi:PrsW family intramembrane metalloprotease [Streptomyces bauhiniae]|uniref:PrsW family intramembrane metalloprotease n=1 Tax=Streptomyces bauhiniae TaxID=2340725 RepID=UPI0035E2D56E